MSRRVLIIGIVFMIAPGLPACVSVVAPAKPITITWWINPWRIAPGFPADKAPTAEDLPKWASDEFMSSTPV